eukprot:CAMPEP_0202451182 /NCGR_PEP_ID=MMETSP1360-20130828/9666_1 /ASSEMBLY_ACC=CAM_ASM_000848 /TAXON_ID=515479 /ORGANISM="Licmophora paradoxa, Strain CCMP2313" /LENGTH=420 /DNA_ID=CAMNT_0049069685 /DNA_START=193 /DNA_END=1455 /DNA_ORIENTATION=+
MSLLMDERPPSTMLSASFNQDGGCVAIASNQGFEIFNVSPFQSSVERTLGGGIGHCELLFRCNIIALVGGGETPYAPNHRVLVWDDHVQKAIGELSFRQTVLEIKLRRDAIAVALRDRIYVYNLSDLNLLDKIYTADNPRGLLGMSTSESMVLCCPSVTEGHVRVELYGIRKTVLLEAHESALRALALTEDGSKLATASVKGTVIRVWEIATSACLLEFRRGVERVDMTCLSWSWDHQNLACCSDKGTVHVFSMAKQTEDSSSKMSFSTQLFSSVSKRLQGDQKKSISQIRGVPHPISCAFVPDLPNTLAVVGWDSDGNGVLLLSDYSHEEAVRKAYHVLAKSANLPKEEEETEGQRRRRRMLASPPVTTKESSEDKIYVGERVEVLEKQMKEIRFEEDDGFLNVSGFQTTAEEPLQQSQ